MIITVICPPRDLATNRRFDNLCEIWLEGDHYKWRAMRANGVDERFCTGDASPVDKFLAWARTVPHTLRNPLYHWTHLELMRYFGIDDLLDESSAWRSGSSANELLATDELRAQGILGKFNVKAVCTTDDPTDSLDLSSRRSTRIGARDHRVLPTFRPDQRSPCTTPTPSTHGWTIWRRCTDIGHRHVSTIPDALQSGTMCSTPSAAACPITGWIYCPVEPVSPKHEAAAIFDHGPLRPRRCPMKCSKFACHLMRSVRPPRRGEGLDQAAASGRAAQRQHAPAVATLGRDTGFDSIGDWPQGEALGAVPRPARPGQCAAENDHL